MRPHGHLEAYAGANAVMKRTHEALDAGLPAIARPAKPR